MRSQLLSTCIAVVAAAMLVPSGAVAQGGAAQASAPARAAAGGMCVPEPARRAVEECPSGAPARVEGTPQASAPRSRLRAAKRVGEETKKQGPRGPSIEIDMATRTNRDRIEARVQQLLDREVAVLNRLIQNTRENDARRPDYLLRLAETYFEMQQAVNARVGQLEQPIFEACRAQGGNRNRCQQLRQQQNQAKAELERFRNDAIRTYARLVQDHPQFRRMDEVLFSLAFGLEELRQFEQARRVYHRLIKGHPTSRFVPHAWLSFAEFYFGEGDMQAAVRFYDKVTEFPPDRNPVFGYALYKQAWAAYNLEDYEGALRKFTGVVEFATQNPDARDAANLARQSRKELVLPYSFVGTPNRALEFFRRYATNNEQAFEMLESLAELYYDTGQWPNTITVYQKLIAEQPRGDKVCYWQTRITNAIISSRPKDEQVREVQRMVDLYEAYMGQSGHSTEAIQQCKATSAQILVQLSTFWHREAIGTADQPGTNDRNTMRLAAQLYRLVVDKFPDMERLEFPDLNREDWPTQYKVAYYYAELLWKMEEWAQCGPAFDRVVELNPRGEYTQDAAYAAVLCYNSLYQQQYSRRERETRAEGGAEAPRGRARGRGARRQQEAAEAPTTERREFTDLERGMLNAFQRYSCFVPDSEELPTIKYRRARIFYEANHFEEAALVFKDIAWNHRSSDLAVYAANLYLDSLNVLGTQGATPKIECIDDLEQAIDPLWGFYCDTQAKFDEHQELCNVLQQLRCDVMRKKMEAHQTRREFREAANIGVTIVRRYRECGRLDEVLYNTAINFEAAKLLGRAIQVRKVLIERFPESNLSKRAVYLLGANYHALAIYSQAAEFYEQFATRYPGEDGTGCSDEDRTQNLCPIAHEALQNAVFFRLGLGEEDKAIADARLFERNYRTRLPAQTAQVIFSLGSIYERQQNWREVVRHYEGFLRTYARQALPQQVIRANVQIGKAYWAQNDKRRAQGFFDRAVRAFSGGAVAAITSAESDETKRALMLYEAKDAASEALFYLAEYKYAEFREIRFPAYRGGRNLERVNKWSGEEFGPWVQRKMQALRNAEAEYNKLAELEVPQWQIAGAARIGEMFRSFVDEFRDAPIPEEISSDEELYGIYVDALDQQSEPLKLQAVQKFEFCLITATRVRWFNPFSKQCEEELNRLNPREYPLAAELRGAPSYVESTAGRPGPVELGARSEEEEAVVEGGGES